MNRYIVAEKVASIGLASLVVATLPPLPAQKIAFVLGHAHILAAWLYFYLAGKMTRGFCLQFGLLTLALFGSYWLWPWYAALILITPLFFLGHVLLDEVYLLQIPLNLRQSPLNLGRFLEIGIFFTLCTGQILISLGMVRTPGGSLLVAGCLTLLYGLLWVQGKHRPDGGSLYFWASNFLFLGLVLWRIRFNYISLMAFLILVHVLDWYFHYYLQLQPGSPARRLYLTRIGILIGLSAAVYWAGHFHVWQTAAQLYEERFYDLWSLVHLTFSLRLTDFQALTRSSQEV